MNFYEKLFVNFIVVRHRIHHTHVSMNLYRSQHCNMHLKLISCLNISISLRSRVSDRYAGGPGF